MVPSLDWFIYAFVRKERCSRRRSRDPGNARRSPRVRGGARRGATPTSRSLQLPRRAHLRAHPAALPEGLPLSMRLLNETHRHLMSGARGAEKAPGEVRTTQNWVGGTRPARPRTFRRRRTCSRRARAFERYVHADDGLPKLVRAGLLHVQFETIHLTSTVTAASGVCSWRCCSSTGSSCRSRSST